MAIPIDKRTAEAMAKIFMKCYRRGVNDARLNRNDEGLLREYIDETGSGRRLGFLGDTAKSFVYWKNRLIELAEQSMCYRQIDTYFSKIHGGFGRAYHSAFPMLAMMFYHKGICDYLEYPDGDITRFNQSEIRTWWDGGRGKKFDKFKLRSQVQDMCIRRSEEIGRGADDALKASHYEVFSRAFSLALTADRLK